MSSKQCVAHSAYAPFTHGRVRSTGCILGVWNRYKQDWKKVGKFFLWEIWKIDKRLLWDIVGGVPTLEVQSGRDDHCPGLGTNRVSDIETRSKSPKGPRLMFGKGGQGTTARRD